MSTPLAPLIIVTTPCEETEAVRVERRVRALVGNIVRGGVRKRVKVSLWLIG